MSIRQLEEDIKNHFDMFERVPLGAALKERDARACIMVVILCLGGFGWTVGNLHSMSAYVSMLIFAIVGFFTLLCAVQMDNIYTKIRLERLRAKPGAPLMDLKRKWMCRRYRCAPRDLVNKANVIREYWERWQDIKKIADDDPFTQKFFDFFSLPESGRFIALLVAGLAIVATLITLDGDASVIFEIMGSYKLFGAYWLIFVFLAAELVVLYILLWGFVRVIGFSAMEHLMFVPLNNRRVYRYLRAMYLASEPSFNKDAKESRVGKVASGFFMPVSELWAGFVVVKNTRRSGNR